jgi:outer membrane protein OmpA-like peptidoglycan-associated protein
VRPPAGLLLVLALGCGRDRPAVPPADAVPGPGPDLPAGAALPLLDTPSGRGLGAVPDLPPLTPPPAGAAVVPLPPPPAAGLRVTSASATPGGDSELATVTRPLGEGAAEMNLEGTVAGAAGRPEPFTARRLLRGEDLDTAHTLSVVFEDRANDIHAGTTAGRVSRAVYRALRTTGRAPFAMDLPPTARPGGLLALAGLTRHAGELRVVGDGHDAVPVLLNGARRWVAALAAQGWLEDPDGRRAEVRVWVADDSVNPIGLRLAVGPWTSQVVSIDAPPGPSAPGLEATLAAGAAAGLPGVRFETGSARLMPASAAALDEAAAVLRRHPGWRVRVEGHTDSVGGPAANRELSLRRAASVRDALVERLGPGSAGRFTIEGAGADRPLESNDTLEGRARNRRVELHPLSPAGPGGAP